MYEEFACEEYYGDEPPSDDSFLEQDYEDRNGCGLEDYP